MMNTEAARENRLRKSLDRSGYALRKDRARSRSLDHCGGYRIIDPYRNSIEAGERFDLTLVDVENFLK